MAKKIIKAQMKQRRDTFANWAAENPVLLDGELGIVSDDPNLYKVGDGSTAWNALPFRGFDGTLVQEEGTSANAAMSQKAVTEALAKKIDADGHYPKLHAGKADDLAGHGESTPEEFTFRASGGRSIKDGSATIKELEGNAVVWNQKLSKEESYGNNATLSYNGNEITATLTDAANADGYGGIAFRVDIIRDHYYHVSFQQLHSDSGINKITIGNAISGELMNNNIVNHALIVHCSYAGGNAIYINTDGNDIAGKSFSIEGLTLTDLTQMFRSGNEPTTIEEYNSRKPIVADEYAYNEGEVIPFTAEGIKSVGDNAWDEQWEVGGFSADGVPVSAANRIRSRNYIEVLANEEYYCNKYLTIFLYDDEMRFLSYVDMNTSTFTTPSGCRYIKFYLYGTEDYNHDILISLYHSGWKAEKDDQYQPYWQDTLLFNDPRIAKEFPNGIHIGDKVYNKDGKGYIRKGTGTIDLGSLNWFEFSEVPGVWGTSDLRASIQHPLDNGVVANIICDKYACREWFGSSAGVYQAVDGICADMYGDIYVGDKSFTSAASLKASLSGVTLYYELAEPTIIEYAEPFRLDYKVADFGTEELLASLPSAPIKGRMIYQFNAVDQIRDNATRIAQLEALLTAMQAQITSLINNPE